MTCDGVHRSHDHARVVVQIIHLYAAGIFFILLLLTLIYASWRHYAPSLESVHLTDEVKSALNQVEASFKSKKRS